MSWPTTELQFLAEEKKGSIVSGPFGSNISARFFVDEGVPVIRGNNLTLGCSVKFIDSGFAFLTEDKAAEFKNCVAIKNDLVFTAAGTIGQIGIIPENTQYPRYIISNKQMRVRIDKTKAEPLFVYYWLTSQFMTDYIIGRNNGGAVPLLNLGIIRKLPVPIPDLSTQNRVVAIFSAYDSLIATNQRRIALLEDAARRIYREWFVHLRFPGHETVKVVDGVPEGWKRQSIGELFDYHIGGGWGKEEADGAASDAAFVIRGTDIPKLRQGAEADVPLRYHPPKNLASRRLQDGDLIFEVSGGSRDQGVGRLLAVTELLLSQFDKPVMCASFCKLIRPVQGAPEYLALMLDGLREAEGLRAFENQSASNIINFAFTDFCDKQMAYIPAQNVLQSFKVTVQPLWLQIAVLGQQQVKLARARDLLLPKLMSGQLDVSGIILPGETTP